MGIVSRVVNACRRITRIHEPTVELIAPVVISSVPPIWVQSIVISMSVCLSVCLSVLFVCLSAGMSEKPHVQILPYFLLCCYLWPWLGPPLTAVRYVMYFRFCG